MRCKIVLMISLALAACPSGCQSKPPTTAIVSGQVTYQKKPVTGGTIRFAVAPGGPVQQVRGLLSKEGKYNLGGVPIGKARVAIETASIQGKIERRESPPGFLVYTPIPARYTDTATSDIEVSVRPGEQVFNIHLP